jgi:hypothetical protein
MFFLARACIIISETDTIAEGSERSVDQLIEPNEGNHVRNEGMYIFLLIFHYYQLIEEKGVTWHSFFHFSK